MRRVIIAIIAVLFLAGFALIGAANGAAPGDTLYPLDRSLEEIRYGIVRNPEDQVAFRLANAEERLEEIEALLKRGSVEDVQTALLDFSAALAEVTDVAIAVEGGAALNTSDSLDKAFVGGKANTGAPCTGAVVHPVGEELANRYGAAEGGYDEIMGWFCQGFGFGEIQLAYELAAASDDYAPEDLFLMRQQRLGWGEIMQVVGVLDVDNTLGDDLEDNDREDEDRLADGDTSCTGNVVHPHGQDLAEQFGVSYEEIMERFCDGYGFGEIKLAYTIRDKTGANVEDVFADRAAGMGWGNIMKKHDLKGAPGKPDNPGKSPPGQDKNKGKGK